MKSLIPLFFFFFSLSSLHAVVAPCSWGPIESGGGGNSEPHSVTLVDVVYDTENDTSTWFYSFTSGRRPSISHITFELLCPDILILDAGVWTQGSGGRNLLPKAGMPEPRNFPAAPRGDPTTGLSGLKFDLGFDDHQSRNYYFTVNGQYAAGYMLLAFKAGPGDTPAWICGPSAACETVVPDPQTNYVFLVKEWRDHEGDLVDVPSDLPENFVITASSSLGTATGTYVDGVWAVTYPHGNGLEVPVGETYTVDETGLLAGWSSLAGVGEFLVDYAEANYQGVDSHFLHRVVNQGAAPEEAAIRLLKTATPVQYRAIGDVITYTFTVKNTGDVDLTDVMIVDDLVEEVVGGPLASLPRGAVDNTTFTATYVITPDDMIDGSVRNVATVTAKDPEQEVVSDEDDAVVTRLGPPPVWSSVGDTVWLDANRDGVMDPGEVGVPGVVVRLLSGAGEVLAETETDADGKYLFEFLVDGVYQVEFVLPEVYSFTLAGLDSVADPVTGRGPRFTLDPGQDRLDQDAGLVVKTAAITLQKEGVFIPGSLDPWEKCDVFGLASLFNAVIFGDLTVTGGDTEGRLAVGGNFTYVDAGYSVGLVLTGHPMPTYYAGQTDSFIVVGDLADGVFGVNGNVVYGGERSGNQRFMVDGNVLRQQNPITLDAHGNVPADGSGITFAEMHARLIDRSTELADMDEQGVIRKTLEPWGDLYLEGDHEDLNIFEVPATNWTRSIDITVPEGATVLVNVVGETVDIRNGSMILHGITSENLLVNFVDARSFTIDGYLHEGSVLAPHADAYFQGGAINGRAVFGGNVEKVVGSEFHNFFFVGQLCLEDREEPPSPPAIHYTFTVANSGDVPLHDISIDDLLVEVTGGPLATLGVGVTDATTFSAILELSESDLVADKIVNVATAIAHTEDGLAIAATDDAVVSGFGWPAPVFNTNAVQSVGGVDFVVQAVELWPVPSMAGTRFQVTVKVRNDGEASGIPQAVAVWFNLDQWQAEPAGPPDMDLPDSELLAPGSIRTYEFEDVITAPSQAGTYHVIARVDPDNQTEEWSTGNNFGGATYTIEEVDVEVSPNPDGEGVVLQWNSVAGFYYFVDRAAGLMGEPFVDIADNLPATPPVNSFVDTDPPEGGMAFYRVWGYRP